MSGSIDPTWIVPIVFLPIALVGVVWAALASRAFDRRWGRPGDAAKPAKQPEPRRTF